MNRYICILLMTSLWLLCCESKRKNFDIDETILKYTSDSIDLQNLLSSKYKVVSCKIRDGRINLMAIDNNSDCYFIVVDIDKKKIINIVPNVKASYYSTLWDVDSGKIISASNGEPYDLVLSNLTTGERKTLNLGPGKWLGATEIHLINNSVYYTSGVNGTALVNLLTGFKLICENVRFSTNPLSNLVLLPISDSLNLISGYTIGNNEMMLYAISGDSVYWKHPIIQDDTRRPISLLSYNDRFIVKCDSALFSLKKSNGDSSPLITMGGPIEQIYKWKDKVLIYSIISSSNVYGQNEKSKCSVVVKMIESKHPSVVWSKEIKGICDFKFRICNDHLFLTDSTMKILRLVNGEQIEDIKFGTEDKNHFDFETLIDQGTGKSYLRSYNNKIYW